jgi:hypothetical protein
MLDICMLGFSCWDQPNRLAPTKRLNQLTSNYAEIYIMKKSIAFGFALSILAAGSAFASPEHINQRAIVDASTATVLDSKVASKEAVKPFATQTSGTVTVAENRKEFGSSYQRER